MLTPEEDDWVYQRGPSTATSTTKQHQQTTTTSSSSSSSRSSSSPLPSLTKRRYEANLNYRVTFCENTIIIRHGGNLDIALILYRDRIAYGNEIMLTQLSNNNIDCGNIIQEITVCAILGTIVIGSGSQQTPFIVLVTDAIPICKLPGGHVIMEVTKVSCIPYNPKLSDSTIKDDSTSTTTTTTSDTNAIFALTERVEKLFSNGGYYYCRSYDITHGQQWHNKKQQEQCYNDINNSVWLNGDTLFCWNRRMTQNMLGKDALIPNNNINDHDRWCTVLMQGYISSPTPLSDYLDAILIGRRSCQRAGTRYNNRGIDDCGNVANFVETELLLCNKDVVLASHTQIRGSVPAFWQQNPSTQQLDITRSKDMTVIAYEKHISDLMRRYGPDGCLFLNLLSSNKSGNEGKLSNVMKDIMASSKSLNSSKIHIIDYDFSKMVKTNDVDSVFNIIIDSSKKWIDKYGWWQIGIDGINSKGSKLQTGVVRTNCLDCLDRTNAGQLAISLYIVPKILTSIRQPVSVDVKKVITTLWAQHGDQISMHYTGTGSVLTTLVTQGKCTWQNKVQQKVKSANRYRINNFGSDRDRQTAIDATLKLAKSSSSSSQNSSSLSLPTTTPVVRTPRIIEDNKGRDDRIILGDNIRQTIIPTMDNNIDNIDTRPLSVWVGTWNVNATRVWNQEDLSEWMRLKDDEFFEINDVYVVGMQEFVDLNAKALIKRGFTRVKKKFDGDTEHSIRKAEFANEFNRLLIKGQQQQQQQRMMDKGGHNNKCEKYIEVYCTAMVGIYISIFVKESLINNITNIHCKKVKGGLGGSHGNKGGIILSMIINKTLLTLTSLQLEAGERMMEIRNEQLYLIMAEYKQQLRQYYTHSTLQTRRVIIIFGDFNFRLNCDRTTAIRLIEKGDLERLSEYDQYKQGECLDPILVHCKEGPFANFLPTYKFQPGTHEYSNNRTPSWCDRIFFNYTKPGSLWLRSYHSHHRYLSSDHKPISATFTLETGTLIQQQQQQQQQQKEPLPVVLASAEAAAAAAAPDLLL